MQNATLSGLSGAILFLKATSKKKVWIPQFAKKNGQVVGGHYAMVHVSDDHDVAKVAAGQGSYSQKKAHAKLAKEEGDAFHNLPDEDKAGLVLHHATQIQDEESAAARMATLRKKLLGGEKPTGGEWKAFHAAPADKQQKILDDVHKAGQGAAMDAQYAAYVASLPAEPAPATQAAEAKTDATQGEGKADNPEAAPQPAKADPAAVKADADGMPKSPVIDDVVLKPLAMMAKKAEKLLADGNLAELEKMSYGLSHMLPDLLPEAQQAGQSVLDFIAAAHVHVKKTAKAEEKPATVAEKPATESAGGMSVAEAKDEKPAEAKPAEAQKAPQNIPKSIPAGAPKKPNIIGSKLAAVCADEIAEAIDKGDIAAIEKVKEDMPSSGKLKWQKLHKYADDAIAYLQAEKKPVKVASETKKPAPDLDQTLSAREIDEPPAKAKNSTVEEARKAAKDGDLDKLMALSSESHGAGDQVTGDYVDVLMEKLNGKQYPKGPKEGDTKPGANGGTLVLKDGHWIKEGEDQPAAASSKHAELQADLEAAGVKTTVLVGKGVVLAKMAGKQPYPMTYANQTQASNAAQKMADKGFDAAVIGDHPYLVKIHGKVPGKAPAAAAEKPKVSLELMAKISGAKLPSENTNSKSFNPKVDAIMAAAKAGDAQALLAMGYGVNTYGVKAAKLANEVLAALGSDQQVKVGQKAGTHAGASGAPAAPAKAAAPAKEQAEPPVKPTGITEGFQSLADDTEAAFKKGDKATVKDVQKYLLSYPTAPKELVQYVDAMAAHMDGKPAAKPPRIKAVKPDATQMPKEIPEEELDKMSATAIDALYDAESAFNAGDAAKLKQLKENAAGLTGAGFDKVNKYLDEAIASVEKNPAKEQAAPAAKAGALPYDEYPVPPAGINPTDAIKIMHAALDGDVATIKQIQAQVKEEVDAGSKTGQAALMQADKVLGMMQAKAEGKPAAPAKQEKAAPAATTLETTYHNTEDGHNKEWSVSLHGKTLVTKYGKIGAKQQQTSKEFAHAQLASDAYLKIVTEKISNGYVKVSGKQIPNMAGQATTQAEQGPKDGDTKQGADGMLVFKDGRWHKVGDAPAAAHAKTPAELKKLAASVPIPKLTGKYAKLMTKTMNELKAIAQSEGSIAYHVKVLPSGAVKIPASPDGFVSQGWKILKPDGSQGANAQALANYAKSLLEKMGDAKSTQPASSPAAANPAAAKPAAAASAPHIVGIKNKATGEVKHVLVSDVMSGGIKSIDDWKKTGEQKGSNKGGFYTDDQGTQWYVKVPESDDHVKNELLANKLYAALGIKVPEVKQVKLGGKLSIASKVIDGLKKDPEALKTSHDMLDGFAADAWLGNWDAVGLGYDNAMVDKKGSVHRIDPGGALLFRAQGTPKGDAFGNAVTEFDTLRDPKLNPQSAAVFGGMTNDQIKESVKQVLLLKDSAIQKLVMAYGPGDKAAKEALVKKLLARKADIAMKFPDVAAEVAPKKIVQIAPAPNFMEWNGPGQGLSSKSYINQQNQELADQMQKLASDGKLDDLEHMTYQPISYEDGTAVGNKQPIAQHKSKHIPMYWKDLVAAVKNPIRSVEHMKDAVVETVGGVFGTLSSIFDDVKKLGEAASKIGRYALVGAVDGDPFESWKITELSQKNGAINAKDLYDASHVAYNKLSTIERQAIKEYTGSGYSSMNNAATGVGSHGKTDQAIAGVDKASVPLKPGTVLSRKFSFNHGSSEENAANIEKFLNSEGGIIKDFGIISTSLNPGVWSGNIHLRIVCGEGVKGCYVAPDPHGKGSAISSHPGEDEVILPYGTKFFVRKVHKTGHKFTDAHGTWGNGPQYVVEVVALPNT